MGAVMGQGKEAAFKQQRPLGLFGNIVYLHSFTEKIDTISLDYKGMSHLGTYCSENREQNAAAQGDLVRVFQGKSTELDVFRVQKHLNAVNCNILSNSL